MRYKVERKFKPKIPVQGTYICRECEESFEGFHTYNKPVYCSENCKSIRSTRLRKATQARFRAKRYHPPEPRKCVMCDKTYTPGGTRSDSRFCSLRCCLRGNQIERTYKIELEDYHSMVVKQQGMCAACCNPFDSDTPYIDHNHETGQVRGLVHGKCNSVLGFVNDDPLLLENLAKYLRRE